MVGLGVAAVAIAVMGLVPQAQALDAACMNACGTQYNLCMSDFAPGHTAQCWDASFQRYVPCNNYCGVTFDACRARC
jgi:hypothetical protein